VSLTDSDRTVIVFNSALPDEALDALTEINWSEAAGGYLTWEAEQGGWFNILPASPPPDRS
jgi:hypothetical protein